VEPTLQLSLKKHKLNWPSQEGLFFERLQENMSQDKVQQRYLRNFLILPGLQLKILVYFVVLFFMTTASLYGTSYFFFWRLNQKALNVGIPAGHVFFRFIENQKQDLDTIFSILTGVNLLLLLVTGIVVSHRIAGPYLKLKNYLRDVGPHSDIFKLRDKDFFRDLEGVVNSLKDKMK
jgi:hypothetical protein